MIRSAMKERSTKPARKAGKPDTPAAVKQVMGGLFDDLLAHDGYGQLELFVRILSRGQKEIIVRCGKEYRFVLDTAPGN